MSGDGRALDLSGQAGDVGIGQAAGGAITNNHAGADPNRLLQMVELLIRNDWDDRQDRDRRQAEADFHREMTRQRLERIADDVADSARRLAALETLSRWMLVVLAAVVLALIGVIIDRALAALLASLAGGALAYLRIR